MLSRVAEALYWTSRYVERAENVARLIDVSFNLMLDTPVQQRSGWQSLVLTTGDQIWFEQHYGSYGPNEVGWFLTFDRSYANSILSSIIRARENAQTVREVISREMWQELNECYLMVRDASRRPFSLSELVEFYQRLKLSGIHYEGVAEATLKRGESWHFTRLGRLMERADKTSRILDVQYYALVSPGAANGIAALAPDPIGWTALLSSASALQVYRQSFHSITPQNVANFLLLSHEFPRSIARCVAEAQASLHEITGTPLGTCRLDVERSMGKLRSGLSYALIGEIMESGLHQYVDQLQTDLNRIGDEVSSQFFFRGQ
jgi:uncharacterized alpha-E superfamily protein